MDWATSPQNGNRNSGATANKARCAANPYLATAFCTSVGEPHAARYAPPVIVVDAGIIPRTEILAVCEEREEAIERVVQAEAPRQDINVIFGSRRTMRPLKILVAVRHVKRGIELSLHKSLVQTPAEGVNAASTCDFSLRRLIVARCDEHRLQRVGNLPVERPRVHEAIVVVLMTVVKPAPASEKPVADALGGERPNAELSGIAGRVTSNAISGVVLIVALIANHGYEISPRRRREPDVGTCIPALPAIVGTPAAVSVVVIVEVVVAAKHIGMPILVEPALYGTVHVELRTICIVATTVAEREIIGHRDTLIALIDHDRPALARLFVAVSPVPAEILSIAVVGVFVVPAFSIGTVVVVAGQEQRPLLLFVVERESGIDFPHYVALDIMPATTDIGIV